MTKGLDKFREHFAGHADKFALIGGLASYMLLDEAGLTTRSTKDYDIVLCLETLDTEFVRVFWEFVKAGGYQTRQHSTGKRTFYRFAKPTDENYPAMLELFSRRPDDVLVSADKDVTPIPTDEEVSSLSAILLDDDYYAFVHANRRQVEGMPVVTETCLIPLKAVAWLNLTDLKASGKTIDSRNISKHQNDIVRLSALLVTDKPTPLPKRIHDDLNRFLDGMAEREVDLKSLGRPDVTREQLVESLRKSFPLQSTTG